MRDKTSWRAVVLSFAGYLVIAPPAFAQPPTLVHVLGGIFRALS